MSEFLQMTGINGGDQRKGTGKRPHQIVHDSGWDKANLFAAAEGNDEW
jgi:hypothetical protein